jgi:hypothetical protein
LQALHPHPDQRVAGGLSIQVTGHWASAQALSLCFSTRLDGADPIRVPPPLTPEPADGLWQQTCFEMFVAGSTGNTYLEYNLSPSGRWARYRFSDERVRDTSAEQRAGPVFIPIHCEQQADCLRVQATLPLNDLPPSTDGWRVGLSAVLEHADGRLSYWALHHPCPKPDFHHPAGRVLRLTPPALP